MSEKDTKPILRMAKKLERFQQENIELEQQNKRYQKHIAVALSEMDDCDFESARSALLQALEESE